MWRSFHSYLKRWIEAMEPGGSGEQKKIWVTLSGLPLTITLDWPFHRSTSGADFWVLHADIRLENSDGLHAPMAVNLSATVREVVASLEPKDVEAPVINALRKEVDRRQVEFLKSGKLKPVAFSSRYYDFKRGRWVFGKARDEEIAEFLERKVYWQTKLKSNSPPARAEGEKDGAPAVEDRVWVGDPTDAQYLEASGEHLVEIAARLAGNGLVQMEGERAVATAGLMGQAERFEAAMRMAVEVLEKKHAFERG
jgi:hypothetical protein